MTYHKTDASISNKLQDKAAHAIHVELVQFARRLSADVPSARVHLATVAIPSATAVEVNAPITSIVDWTKPVRTVSASMHASVSAVSAPIAK